MLKKWQILVGIVLILVIIDAAIVYFFWQNGNHNPLPTNGNENLNVNQPITLPVEEIKQFDSEDDFKAYLVKADELSSSYGNFGMARNLAVPSAIGLEDTMSGGLEEFGAATGLDSPKLSSETERISTTNVQVSGIDEPDIVKTDGKEIYFSKEVFWSDYGIMEEPLLKLEAQTEAIMPVPPRDRGGIKTIKAFPPADLKVDAELDTSGELLLSKNILVVFTSNKIYGYDVNDPTKPEKKWTAEMEDNNSIIASRLYNDKIYLVTRTNISHDRPCPIRPLSIEGNALEIKCGDIYHPAEIIPTDTTFTAMILNPASGQIEQSLSFVGSASASLLYMSQNNIYVTYNYPGDIVKYFYNFLKQNNDLVPSWVIERLDKLANYDLSLQAKMIEIESIISSWEKDLNSDDRLKLDNEMQNRSDEYAKEHKRDLEQTGIVKISVVGLKILANGSLPGQPLNQFALDEYQDNLRVATTVGGGWLGMGLGGRTESANDVYVLDGNLKIIGAIKDMGLTERIYSARFIEDKGYLVTFRQTDPFYVLDLSNPNSPQLKGELKIPGYSGYLHPLSKDKILGVGQENWQVKLAIFDVSDPANPKEVSKYLLSENWSEAINNHHAFLMDDKFQVFFLPGGQGGYVFSYKDNDLNMLKAVSDLQVKRALYLNDYLYIIGDEKITVLNEKDWEKVNQLEF